MKLQELINLLPFVTVKGDIHTEITGISMDSRMVEKGDIFICVPGIQGFLADRHDYASEAVDRGACALVVERDVDVNIPKLFVKDARRAMAIIATHFYGYPSREMHLIGITGTNGKTTTSHLLERILHDSGKKTGLMGNNGIKYNDVVYPTNINTQEPLYLQKNLRLMRSSGTNVCVMEVTSQGLDMGRVIGCKFQMAIFTNLTQDHLDYHGTFEKYRETKGLLFSRLGNASVREEQCFAVINADDPNATYFIKQTAAAVITYGLSAGCDVRATNIKMGPSGTIFTVKSMLGEIEINLPFIGEFNVYNALAAITGALLEGVSLNEIKNSLENQPSVRGRMESVDEGQDFSIFVDYAHTPDALENALRTIRNVSNGRILTVVGCGGDRDVTKRPIMGHIASTYSDVVLFTSDNPRSEDPVSILDSIISGVEVHNRARVKTIVDRKEAIHQAISLAQKGDVVLIAGKGHETYQIIKDDILSFDDKLVASSYIKSLIK